MSESANGVPAATTADLAVVVGTGLMARGIAAAFAGRGTDVLVLGRDTAKARATARDAENLCAGPTSGKEGIGDITSGVLGSISLRGATIAVETVIENLEAKCSVLAALEGELAPEAIIATNTASLPLAAMSAVLANPERFAGWHFMNPAHQTALAEVVPGPDTSTETLTRLAGETLALGKTPIELRYELPGFVWNRLIFAMWRECEHIVQSGAADRASVDAAVSDGLAPRWIAGGPFVTMDLGGLDDFVRAAAQILPALSNAAAVPEDLELLAAEHRSLYGWSPEQQAATERLRGDSLATGASFAKRRRRIGLA